MTPLTLMIFFLVCYSELFSVGMILFVSLSSSFAPHAIFPPRCAVSAGVTTKIAKAF